VEFDYVLYHIAILVYDNTFKYAKKLMYTNKLKLLNKLTNFYFKSKYTI